MAAPSLTNHFDNQNAIPYPWLIEQNFDEIIAGLSSTESGTGWDVSVASLAAGTLSLGGTALTLPVSAVNGGTGLAAYAVGDLLAADTTTTLSRVADVATGNALISGGVGALPSYGKIGLTTHISGTLAVGNGGTGVATLAINGILFGNTTGVVQVTAAAASSVLVTSALNVPSLSTDLPTAVTIGSAYIYRAGGTDIPITDGGTGLSALGAADTLLCVDDAGTAFNYRALSVGTTGTDFAIVQTDAGGIVFNLPDASGTVRGALTSANWTTFNNKQAAGNYITALTGEVTAAGPGSVAATIAANAVTLAKMADMATASFLGRNTAATGDPEVLSVATTRTMLSIGNVENTALSTWAGTTNITTLGTISTGGTYNGQTITSAANFTGTLAAVGATHRFGTAGTATTLTVGQGGTGTDAATIYVQSGNSGSTIPMVALLRSSTSVGQWNYDGTQSNLDTTGGLKIRALDNGFLSMLALTNAGNATLAGTLTVVGMGAGAGTYPVKWVSGGLLTYDSSSVRFKENVRDYALAAKVIDALVVRQFEYNDKTINPGQWDYGMIAEEVMVFAPELVACDPDGKPGTVRYDRLGVLAIQEIQRLRRRVAALEAKA